MRDHQYSQTWNTSVWNPTERVSVLIGSRTEQPLTGAFMFSSICPWTTCWVNVTVMATCRPRSDNQFISYKETFMNFPNTFQWDKSTDPFDLKILHDCVMLAPDMLCMTDRNKFSHTKSQDYMTHIYIRGSFYWNGLTLFPARRSYLMPSKVRDEIIYQFPNFNCCTIDAWEWINDFLLLKMRIAVKWYPLSSFLIKILYRNPQQIKDRIWKPYTFLMQILYLDKYQSQSSRFNFHRVLFPIDNRPEITCNKGHTHVGEMTFQCDNYLTVFITKTRLPQETAMLQLQANILLWCRGHMALTRVCAQNGNTTPHLKDDSWGESFEMKASP